MGKPLINPYTVGPPVMGGNFYGRDKLLNKVGRSLRSTNVVLLQGQRRIGKTSFLRQLAYFLSHEEPDTLNLPLRIPVIFDIQRYVQDTLPQFQLHLAGAITRAVESLRKKKLSVPGLSEWEFDSTLFQDKWLPYIYEEIGREELVILVDEFDNFDEKIAPHAMQTLVPFLGQLLEQNRLKWVFTIGRLSGKVSLEYDPIVRSGEEFNLAFLNQRETRQLITKPGAEILTYQSEAIRRIYHLTNGQPHLIQAVCSKIFEYLLEKERDTVTIEVVNAVIPQTLEAYGSAIASIVSVPPIEERILAAVAQLTDSGQATTRNEVIDLLIDNGIRINREDLTNAINSLLEWKLLKGGVQNLRITVELVQRWLIQNRLVEPTQQENLDIQSTLAKSRFDFAEQALQVGQYELAIKDYKESLEYIPTKVEALRGLAEAYRLNNNIADRVTTLKKLYLHDTSIINEMIEALEAYAQECEKKGELSTMAEQYESLLAIQNRTSWHQRLIYALVYGFDKQIAELEKKLALHKDLDYTEIAAREKKDSETEKFKYLRSVEDSENNSSFIQDSKFDNFLFRVDTENYREKEEIEEAELERLDSYYQRPDVLESIVPHERYLKKKALIQLNELSLELITRRQRIEDELKKQSELLMDIKQIIEFFEILKAKEWALSQRVKIENSKFEDDVKNLSLLLMELKKAGEQLDKEEEELLYSAAFDSSFKSVINSSKTILLLVFILLYVGLLSWLVKGWYIKVVTTVFAGFLIILGLAVPALLWVLIDEAFLVLRKYIITIMRRSKPNLLFR